MRSNTAIRSYCRETGRALALPRQQREELLAGLRQELEERFPLSETLTMQELFAEVGAPIETAGDLMESVPAEVREQYRSRRKLLTRLAVGGLAVLLAAITLLWIYSEKNHVAYIETYITEDT